MFASSVLSRGKAALQGTETEKKLADLLFDDNVQVISSFELNQIASLTYQEPSMSKGTAESMADMIFEMLEGILSKPANHSTLTLQKALVLTRHILLFGAEKVLSSAIFLGRYVEPLQTYNTVLMAQQQQGAAGIMLRLKGGGVDTGGPVREAATQVYLLLSSPERLQFERNTQADPNSLVPVGSDQDAAFVTDDVRFYILKKRMERERAMEIKSNLAKAEGGFGSGYMSKDGKAVVGAAHGLDEMMKMAQREKQRFSDDGPPTGYSAPQLDDPYTSSSTGYPQSTQAETADYLSARNNYGGSSVQEADLLDFSANNTTSGGQASADLMGYSEPVADLLGSTAPSSTSADLLGTPAVSDTADLLSTLTVNGSDPVSSGTAGLSDPIPAQPMKPPAMNSNQDRFSAFDALDAPKTTTAPSYSAAQAEQRVLGFGGNVGTTTSNTKSGLDSLGSLTGFSMGQPAAAQQTSISLTSIKMSTPQVPPPTCSDDDDENGFVMGGGQGMGLEPMGAAPSAPPPPPPPGGF